MFGYVKTKRILALDKEGFKTFNNCKILIDDMVANNVDNSHLLYELQSAFAEYVASFDEIKEEKYAYENGFKVERESEEK